MVGSQRLAPTDACEAFVVQWEVDEDLWGVSYRRPGGIYEDFVVGSKEDATAVANDINAKAARREFAVLDS